ncbi:CDK-activating kinase assembly factor MAT1-like [Mercenaria mercenaria]|uniref:CDK-activating kinase assembly factor MAT1-like n=1 Tax=Mercenaria mercenaria TaxID=6596 RepID=UPI00234F6CB9|nr:CDK-activating kinase assembly factor MAT1-like [Mercenaria mercenaria]
MDDQGCPRCKTTKYRNPSLKLLVNICGHSLCESCVDLLFIKGSGTCPECGTSLRRNNFRLQLFEDAFVEKEVDIRKKIMKDFNKKEEDFSTLREYNDYLEQLETIIYNLANNIDVESTKKMVEQYKKENKDIIQKNRSKLSKDEEYLEMLIAEEEKESKLRHELDLMEVMKEKNKKKKNKEALIDELMFSDLPASTILAGHNASSMHETMMETEKTAATAFSSGAKFGFSKGAGNIPVPSEVGEAFVYTPCELEILGPTAPSEDDVLQKGYLQNIRGASDSDKAGGYDAKMACQRALMEAMCGLFLNPDDPT